MGESRYRFNNSGVVREILYPNKAIIHFKLNGKEEKAILLSTKLSIDGKHLEENKLLGDFVKIGDTIGFDCHVYDKGGDIGSGKDKCNFFAMRAWKNSKEYELKHGGSVVPSLNVDRENMKIGTGWISELNPRKGVLTFENNGRDERVLFLASKFYVFEKRIGAKQSLSDVIATGDPVQFEAVPQDAEVDHTYHCSWFANLVWKGKRPNVDDSLASTLTTASPLSISRRGSVGSSESSETNGVDDLKTTDNVLKGHGFIAKIVTERTGIIWWVRSYNHFESVWFEGRQTFLLGINLADKNLKEVFKEGDPVSLLVESPPENFPTKWIAKQVLITSSTAKELARVRTPPELLKDEYCDDSLNVTEIE